MASNPYRELPSVDALVAFMRETVPSPLDDVYLTRLARMELDRARASISEGQVIDRASVFDGAVAEVRSLSLTRLKPVINATGVLIHTNLGRSPVSPETAAAMMAAAAGYVALEVDPRTNARGGRMDEISSLMRTLGGAERTLVVNNNAAAVLLTLSALAAGKNVLVSRGESVEIGGGFRVPDVLRQSGGTLVDVGTTNRTYVRDYESAINERTALILRVHPSNFVVQGFTTSPSLAELAEVAGRRSIPIVEDLGSGALIDTARFGLTKEPTIGERLADGATVVTASGDKLLGGPQAGIVAGRADFVERIERHPLARALRADKTCLAGLAATLRHYVRGDALQRVPVWRMIAASVSSLGERADAIIAALGAAGQPLSAIETRAMIGGGSLPGEELPSVAIAIAGLHDSPDLVAESLRTGDCPVFPRIEGDRVVIDLRSILPEHDPTLVDALRACLNAHRTN